MSQSNRQAILQMLISNDTYLSGEELSEQLGVSRTSIWKHIKKLRDKGYQIESVSNLGYRLIEIPRELILEEVQRNLQTKFLGREIVFYQEVDSTNTQAKLNAGRYPGGTVFLADTQNGGRGRLGRQWSSVPGKGLWCSILLKPTLEPTVASQFPLLAAVAITEVLRKYGVDAMIKWPNDILVKGRKVCGILTEMGAEVDRINYLVVGFGLNVKQQLTDFPAELQSIATSLELELPEPVERVQLLCEILLSIEKWYLKFLENGFTDILKRWKELNCTLGKETKVSRFNQPPLFGKALDLNPDGSLVLELPDRQKITILSGEIESRQIKNK